MEKPKETDLRPLNQALRNLIAEAADAGNFPAEILAAGDMALRHPVFEAEQPDFVPLPACQHLDRVFQTQHSGINLQVINRFRESWQAMRWVVNEKYRHRPEMQHYLANACYCEIVGSRGLVERKDVSVGLFLIGPNVNYPPHHHPSPEAYFVLSGTAEWWCGGSEWSLRPPGSLVFHPSNRSHAMRTGVEPLLAFFIWTGDVSELAEVTDGIDTDSGHPAI